MVEAGCEGSKVSVKLLIHTLDSLYDLENDKNSVFIHLYVMINTLIVNRALKGRFFSSILSACNSGTT